MMKPYCWDCRIPFQYHDQYSNHLLSARHRANRRAREGQRDWEQPIILTVR